VGVGGGGVGVGGWAPPPKPPIPNPQSPIPNPHLIYKLILNKLRLIKLIKINIIYKLKKIKIIT